MESLDPLRVGLAASCVGVPVLLLIRLVRARRPGAAVVTAAILATALWLLYGAVFPTDGGTRGFSETATLVASYLAMVAGMLAQYVYAKAERGEKTLTIEWMPMLMPILASPIVFIPLVSIAGEVSATGSILAQPKLMVYLVAFQNGFFWKHFFDERRPAAPAGNRPAPHGAPDAPSVAG